MVSSCHSLDELNEKVTHCRLCPRLVAFRESVPKRASFKDQEYWRRPVPGYGDPNARILLTGLAPAAHGGNRTGRVFTGDESGRFLMQALYKAGFANQPFSITKDDGLILKDLYMTPAVKCVPPNNKPTPLEFATCQQYYHQELKLLHNVKVILALGKLAFNAYLAYFKQKNPQYKEKLQFTHGAAYHFQGFPALYASYHPSPQNTYTGVLTEEMFLRLLEEIKREL